MRSMLTGTAAASVSKRIELSKPHAWKDRRAGFTLIEALVALAVVFAFAAALGPLMFQGQRILVQGNGQVRAELFLRSLLQSPFNRTNPELGIREGEIDGLRWRLDVESAAPNDSDDDVPPPAPKKGEILWGLYKVTANVSWGDGQTVTAQTLQLGQLN
jgi:prepilin-type N-terminal cleavage/methylation domain-containing protein